MVSSSSFNISVIARSSLIRYCKWISIIELEWFDRLSSKFFFLVSIFISFLFFLIQYRSVISCIGWRSTQLKKTRNEYKLEHFLYFSIDEENEAELSTASDNVSLINSPLQSVIRRYCTACTPPVTLIQDLSSSFDADARHVDKRAYRVGERSNSFLSVPSFLIVPKEFRHRSYALQDKKQKQKKTIIFVEYHIIVV